MTRAAVGQQLAVLRAALESVVARDCDMRSAGINSAVAAHGDRDRAFASCDRAGGQHDTPTQLASVTKRSKVDGHVAGDHAPLCRELGGHRAK